MRKAPKVLPITNEALGDKLIDTVRTINLSRPRNGYRPSLEAEIDQTFTEVYATLQKIARKC